MKSLFQVNRLLKNKLIPTNNLSDFLSTFKEAGIYTVFTVINKAVPFFLLPILTYYLSPADIGYITNYQILYNLSIVLVGISIPGAIARYYFKISENSDIKSSLSTIINTSFVSLFISSIICLTICLALKNFIIDNLGFSFEWLLIVITTVLFYSIFEIMLSLFRIKFQPLKFGLFNFFYITSNVGISLLIIFFIDESWEGRVYGILLSSVIFGIISFFFLKKEYSGGQYFSKEQFHYLLKFGLPLIPHLLSWWIVGSIDKIIINDLFGIEKSGLYGLALQLSMTINLIQIALNSAITPRFYQSMTNDPEKGRMFLSKIFKMYFAMILGISIIASLTVYLATPFVFDSFYIDLIYIVPLLIVGKVIDSVYFCFSNFYFYYLKTNNLSLITFSTSLLNIAISYLFLKNFGLIGACYSTILISVLRSTLTYYYHKNIK